MTESNDVGVAVAGLGPRHQQQGEVAVMDEILTSGEVSKWIRVSEATLSRWRQRGTGPEVTWLSPTCPRYKRADVELWLTRVSA